MNSSGRERGIASNTSAPAAGISTSTVSTSGNEEKILVSEASAEAVIYRLALVMNHTSSATAPAAVSSA